MGIGIKKSFYLFLASLLGVLLFLTLHQIFTFIYLAILVNNFDAFSSSMSLIGFLSVDYITMIIVILLGLWYGIWLGMSWYETVYEKASGYGISQYVVNKFWPVRKESYNLRSRIALVARHVEEELSELEHLAAVPKQKASHLKKVASKKKLVGKKLV